MKVLKLHKGKRLRECLIFLDKMSVSFHQLNFGTILEYHILFILCFNQFQIKWCYSMKGQWLNRKSRNFMFFNFLSYFVFITVSRNSLFYCYSVSYHCLKTQFVKHDFSCVTKFIYILCKLWIEILRLIQKIVLFRICHTIKCSFWIKEYST